MLAREYTGQNAGYWHNDVLQKSKHEDHVSYHVIYSIQGVLQSAYSYKPFSILISFENFQFPPIRFRLTEVDLRNTWLGKNFKEWEISYFIK